MRLKCTFFCPTAGCGDQAPPDIISRPHLNHLNNRSSGVMLGDHYDWQSALSGLPREPGRDSVAKPWLSKGPLPLVQVKVNGDGGTPGPEVGRSEVP